MAAISPWRPTMQNHCAKLLRAALTASLVLVAIAGAAVAGPLEDALAARDRGDDATALRLIRPLADQGNAEAQYNLGIMYVTGQGVPKNGEEAAKLFRLAADQGHAPAQYNLGVMHGSVGRAAESW
jgi:TPR repeat protein